MLITNPRVLVMTRLYPSSADPLAAAFNRQQFSALAALCPVDLMAVIPWFPGASLFSRWTAAGRLAAVPMRERIGDLWVRHPRVFYVPRLHALAPALYSASLIPWVKALRGRVDVVLGSWAFPDGVAAVHMAEKLGVPAVVKLHGSDMNVIADKWSPRLALLRALPKAARVVAVSRPLADKAVALGVAPERVALVPNGVDRSLFRPQDRLQARRTLGLGSTEARPIILYVGRTEPQKGLGELFAAFQQLLSTRSDVTLAILGEGVWGDRCRNLAAELPGRVLAPGARPLEEIARWMTACDVLVLPSWNEGTPNVLLEALASGRRVVATRVGGIPDVVSSPAVGELVPPRDASALAIALARAIDTPYDPAVVSAAAPWGWDDSAVRLHEVLCEAVGQARTDREEAA